MRKPLLVFVAFLLMAPPADATLRMYGSDIRPRHWNWARASHMPVPDVRISLSSGGCGPGGGACYQVNKGGRRGHLYLPDVREYGYANERLLLLHELGHAYDYRHLTRAGRAAFRQAVGTRCGWWSRRCYLSATGENMPPGEMFAEMYASCALGWVRAEIDPTVYLTYGWLPPDGSDAQLCALIRSSA